MVHVCKHAGVCGWIPPASASDCKSSEPTPGRSGEIPRFAMGNSSSMLTIFRLCVCRAYEVFASGVLLCWASGIVAVWLTILTHLPLPITAPSEYVPSLRSFMSLFPRDFLLEPAPAPACWLAAPPASNDPRDATPSDLSWVVRERVCD